MDDRIIVGGIPRCGSTMVFRALAGYPPGTTHPRDYKGNLIKAHMLPNKVKKGYKAIFLFGDIINAIISTKLKRYNITHFKHCGCNKDPSEVDIFEEDCLNYEKIFEDWFKYNGFPIICVRYETLIKYIKIIENFLGMRLNLPSWKDRETTYEAVSKEELEKIKKTYKDLIRKADNAPDIAIYDK